jgi:hypothetical protein
MTAPVSLAVNAAWRQRASDVAGILSALRSGPLSYGEILTFCGNNAERALEAIDYALEWDLWERRTRVLGPKRHQTLFHITGEAITSSPCGST